MPRYVVNWFNTNGDTYGGSAATLEDAIQLARTAIPRDAVRVIVKLGNKIMHREAITRKQA